MQAKSWKLLPGLRGSLVALALAAPAAGAATDEAALEVLNPIAVMEVQRVVQVPRLRTLDGKRVLLYSNAKINSDVAVREIQTHLAQRFPTAQFRIVAGTGWAPEPKFYDELMAWKPEAIIASTAD
ncbi:MAG: hypothetical protein IT494_08865 [Gammaproteobacteria bacterium]|nr:hypothetical protein [Gammaproteobacteria bacterium]